jgi:hypothetical protein
MRVKLSLGLVLALGALLAAGPAHAAGSKTFTDPNGDGSAGPDITQLVVSNDDNGQLTFAFTFSNRPTILTGDDIVALGVDADRRGNTGDPAGYEFIFGFLFEGGGQVDVGQWDGSRFNFDAPQTTLRATDGGRTITINRSELGNTAAFDFRVVTQGNGPGDTAPEGGGVWTYELQLQAARPTVTRVRVQFTPAQPRAGKPFTFVRVRLGLSDGQEVAPTSYSCRGTLAGKVLAPRSRCRWNIPRNAKGKRFSVVVTVSYGGETGQSGMFTFRVRA